MLFGLGIGLLIAYFIWLEKTHGGPPPDGNLKDFYDEP